MDDVNSKKYVLKERFKMKKKVIVFLLVNALIVSIIGCGGKADMDNYTDDKFKAGQVWSYQTRSSEEKSTIRILKVENYEEAGTVIHIALDNLHIKDSEGKEHNYISHLPFSKEALSKSVLTMIKENEPLPDFQDGYETWKSAFDAGKAGIWSLTVSEALKYMEEALIKGK